MNTSLSPSAASPGLNSASPFRVAVIILSIPPGSASSLTNVTDRPSASLLRYQGLHLIRVDLEYYMDPYFRLAVVFPFHKKRDPTTNVRELQFPVLLDRLWQTR